MSTERRLTHIASRSASKSEGFLLVHDALDYPSINLDNSCTTATKQHSMRGITSFCPAHGLCRGHIQCSILLIALSLTMTTTAMVQDPSSTYRYFCYGSNVLPATMTKLRGIEPLDATAAVLSGYQLRFDGSDSSRWEPSAAFVLETGREQDVVHGVLYTLTPKDFTTVGWTEGVPFGYRWKRCQVVPYVGIDGQNVGNDLLNLPTNEKVDAITLISPRAVIEKDVPPSSSYLGIIREGAKFWKLDASYQAKLASIPTAKNLIIPGGLSGPLLHLAEVLRKG